MGTVDTTGFSFKCDTDYEDDNRKFFQYITTPDGQEHWLDHSPYEHASFDVYVEFFEKHGRFPTRQDINSCGPLRNEDVRNLLNPVECSGCGKMVAKKLVGCACHIDSKTGLPSDDDSHKESGWCSWDCLEASHADLS
jgi:hypothetical protein